ncbi:MAG: PilN domain-containing protein [Sulfuritalea sp.]|nr:PilN domain-containing protein [Sulfuritalea sp.]
MEFNLLPYREARRLRQRRLFFQLLALSCAVGVLSAFVVAVVFDSLIDRQRYSNDLAKADVKQWDQKIKHVATLQTEIAALKKRQHALSLLQSQRYLPVHVMNALTAEFPDGILLTKVLQSAQGILITGDALSSDAVFEWMLHLAQKSTLFSNPELLDMRLGNTDGGFALQSSAFRFSLRVQLKTAAQEPVAMVKE